MLNLLLSVILLGLSFAAPPTRRNLKIWHITDFHLDTAYDFVNGSIASACHTAVNGSDLGVFGNIRCDAPWSLVDSAIQAMQDLEPNPDMIVWTGDSSTHIAEGGKHPDMKYVLSMEKKITSQLRRLFPKVPILPVLGNHDSSPPDYFPDKSGDDDNFYRNFLDGSGWSDLLPSDQRSQFGYCGFYRLDLLNLTFLGLNTNLYYRSNNTGADPCNQLVWIESMLQKTDNQVIIASHVPPGHFERNLSPPFLQTKSGDHHYNEEFVRIVNNPKIGVQLYGHTHTDTFRLVQDSKGRVTSVALLAPSVTPLLTHKAAGKNPGIRLVSYDGIGGHVNNFEQFYVDLTKANEEAKAEWKKLYDFRSAYKVEDLSVKSMEKFVSRLRKESEVFETYLAHNTVYERLLEPCNATCRRNQLCSINYLTSSDWQRCMEALNETEAFKLPGPDIPGGGGAVVLGAAVITVIALTLLGIICMFFIYSKHMVHIIRRRNYSEVIMEDSE